MQDAILAGIFNDLGSGSNVDLTTIKSVNGKVEVVKEFNCIKPNEVSALRSQINRDVVTHIPRGATRTSRALMAACSQQGADAVSPLLCVCLSVWCMQV